MPKIPKHFTESSLRENVLRADPAAQVHRASLGEHPRDRNCDKYDDWLFELTLLGDV